jgi:diguanylate cyclase (GGDEF)-like protein/PAS domain S-box-containing protein
VVFVLRLAASKPADGITFLYVVPIIVLAIELGRVAGLLSGLAALALFAVWSSVDGQDLGVVAYLTRGVVFVGVGWLTGQMAERLRATAEDAAAATRHFELARDLLCTAGFDGYLIRLNGAWEETLGWTREELMARPFLEFVHPEDRERTALSAAALRAGERPPPLVNRYLTKDGGHRWIEWASRADHQLGLIHAAARDVTDRREADLRVRAAEERFRRSFEDSPIGMALVGVRGDDAGRVLEVNEALVELTGLSRDKLVGARAVEELTHPDDRALVREGLARLASGEVPTFRIEFRMLEPHGERWVEYTTSNVDGADGTPLYRISQIQDIDARRRGEEQLRRLADHDTLTGLLNRRRFHEELERELRLSVGRSGRGAVLLIDLDNFKAVNDTLGHAAGDAVIARVGAALAQRLRTGDVTARLGGDEFAVILRRVTAAEAEQVATELLDHVQAAIDSEDDGAGVTLSIGVAPFEGEGHDADALVKAADDAMYRAKAGGGGAITRAS